MGKPQRPAAQGNHVIAYGNTVIDAVRLLSDHRHTLGPSQALQGDLLESVAQAFLDEHRANATRPAEIFNTQALCGREGSMAVSRMEEITEATLAGVTDRADVATGARDAVREVLGRLLRGIGPADPREGLKAARQRRMHIINRLNTALPMQRAPAYDSSYASWWQSADINAALADTPALRQALLEQTLTHILRDTFARASTVVMAGANTAGRILERLGIPMNESHVGLHIPASTSEARCAREVQVAFRVIAADLQQPGGVLNTQALADYAGSLQRLKLPAGTIGEGICELALGPVREQAQHVDAVFDRLRKTGDGWMAQPLAAGGGQRFTMPDHNRLH